MNAREALKQFFDPKDVTDSIVEAVRSMEDVRREPAFSRVFAELMRYTQLKQVVSDFDQQDRYFDRLSEMWFCKSHVLFWLQWSMAMRDHQHWNKAWQYLDEAYGRAKNLANFDTTHLDDQKAGLLLESVTVGAKSSDFLRRYQEAINLLLRSMNSGDVTSHNYLTVKSFEGFLEKAAPSISNDHRKVMSLLSERLQDVVRRKHAGQFEGFVKHTMEDAIGVLNKAIEVLKE